MALLTPAQTTLLRRAFVDVCRGYSSTVHDGTPIFVHHLSHQDHVEYDVLQSRFRDAARAQGALTDAERLEYIIGKGLWSHGKEKEISDQRDTIARFEEGKRVIVLPSQMREQDKLIQQEVEKLNKIMFERSIQMGVTAETYAQQRLNDYYIINNLFKNKELTEPLFTEASFDDFNDSTVDEITKAYNLASEPCSDHNLRLLSVQDFFISYYTLCADDLHAFFGRPVCEMTYFMVRLAGYARYFKSLMENNDMTKVTREHRNDPEALERAFSIQKSAAQVQSSGSVPTRMSAQDIKDLGLEGQMTPLPQKEMNFQEYLQHMHKHRK